MHRTGHHGLCSAFGLELCFDTLPARGDKTGKSCFFQSLPSPGSVLGTWSRGARGFGSVSALPTGVWLFGAVFKGVNLRGNKRSLDLFGEQIPPFSYYTGDLQEGWTSQPARLMWAGSGVHTLISAGMTVVGVLHAVLVPSTAHREVTITVKIHCQGLSISGLLLRSFLLRTFYMP